MDTKIPGQHNGLKRQPLWLVLGATLLAGLSFLAGRQSLDSRALLLNQTKPSQTKYSDLSALLIQNQNDPREMIPLPGPGQGFGLQPGQGEGECPILLYQDGQLFQFMPGQPGQPGFPGQGNQELIPLQPLPGSPQEGPPSLGPSQFSQVPQHLNMVSVLNANGAILPF
jgi:hypothetical protein